MSFAQASTETLNLIRANLLRGLEEVAARISDGTFDDVGPKGAAPPSQSGHLTLALLEGVEAELADRLRRLPSAEDHSRAAGTALP